MPETTDTPEVDLDEKALIVSCDTHIGPRLRQDLRQYCPKAYLEEFDAFMNFCEGQGIGGIDALDLTTGHWDPHQRLRDLDQDGVVAQAIFHGSQNGQPVPFNISDFSLGPGSSSRHYDVNYELAGVGREIYNRWLGDFCSVEPERNVGLAQLPVWDIDLAIEKAKEAKEMGLNGINFPSESGPTELSKYRRSGLKYYHDPAWDPFWAVCEELELTLCSHGGAGDTLDESLPAAATIMVYESQELQRRPMQRMIFSGVFERFPGLTVVFTEHPGNWWQLKMDDMDSIGYMTGLPELPSFYAKRNCYNGASFQARFEAEDSIENDYWQNIIWGNDYPHVEGTWTYKEDPNETPSSHLSLRYTYANMDPAKVQAMLGLNGIRAYGLNYEHLRKVADKTNAPTLRECVTDIDEIPDVHGMWAFRHQGAFG